MNGKEKNNFVQMDDSKKQNNGRRHRGNKIEHDCLIEVVCLVPYEKIH